MEWSLVWGVYWYREVCLQLYSSDLFSLRIVWLAENIANSALFDRFVWSGLFESYTPLNSIFIGKLLILLF